MDTELTFMAGRSGEVGLGDAVCVAGRPLDQFDAVTVRVGNPAGPRLFRATGRPGWFGRDPLGGKTFERYTQGLDLDDEVVDTRAEVDLASRRVVDLDGR